MDSVHPATGGAGGLEGGELRIRLKENQQVQDGDGVEYPKPDADPKSAIPITPGAARAFDDQEPEYAR